jgi:hypothetical protein
MFKKGLRPRLIKAATANAADRQPIMDPITITDSRKDRKLKTNLVTDCKLGKDKKD